MNDLLMLDSDLYFDMVFKMDPDVKAEFIDQERQEQWRKLPKIIQEHYQFMEKAYEINSVVFLRSL